MLPAFTPVVKRHFITLTLFFSNVVLFNVMSLGVMSSRPLQCATLERLTLDDMIAKSTAIVRGRVTDTWAAFSGSIIYTHYRVQVSETYKGAVQDSAEIVVTGGTVNGMRQNFSGSPTLNPGDQFVFFLWTSKAGLTQIIGLTQGLFALPADDGGSDPLATRAPTRELMLDPVTARAVKDGPLSLRVSQLRSRIATVLTANPGGKQ